MKLRVFRDWIPGPLILFCGQWLGMFSKTHLTHPDWESDASDLALALSVAAAVLLSLLWVNVPKETLRVRATVFAVAMACGVALCLMFWIWLGRGMSSELAATLQELWELTYVTTMILLVSGITTGVMSLEEKKSNYVALGLLVVVIALVAIIAWLFL